MTREEVARRLEEIVDEIYNKLEEIEEILKEVDPEEELGVEEAYWISRIDIDKALLNLLEGTLGILEEEEWEEEWEEEEEE